MEKPEEAVEARAEATSADPKVEEVPAEEITAKCTALFLIGFGGYEKIKPVQVDRPKDPGATEVIVRVEANGLNFAELMCRLGLYEMSVKVPFVMGMEASGEVVAVGSDVKKFKVKNFAISMISNIY